MAIINGFGGEPSACYSSRGRRIVKTHSFFGTCFSLTIYAAAQRAVLDGRAYGATLKSWHRRQEGRGIALLPQAAQRTGVDNEESRVTPAA